MSFARVGVYEYEQGRELILQRAGDYAMDAGVAVLSWLEKLEGSRIEDETWRTEGFGNLIGPGIVASLAHGVELRVTVTYDMVFVQREAGSKARVDEMLSRPSRARGEQTRAPA